MSTIRSFVPRSYADVARAPEAPPERVRRPHDCERCGKHMEWDDQSCACTARSNRIGWSP